MNRKKILVSQPEPKIENSPYRLIKDRHGVNIDFVPFIYIAGVSSTEIRKQKLDLSKFQCIILTSKNAVDHFFRVCSELKYKIPETTKYFCQSESIALYLQKYAVYRKRKIFVGKKSFIDLVDSIKKHQKETFFLPSSDKLNSLIPTTLNKLKINWKQGIFFKTAVSDLSHLKDIKYNILCFFSPTGIYSLLENFPDFNQGDTKIAIFGNTTKLKAEEHKLRVDIFAPTPESPSMTMALDKYLKSIEL